jgi:3-oxoacid CoA-transferase
VFTVHPTEGLTLVEIFEGVGVDEVREKTGASFRLCPNLMPMQQ